MLTSFDLINSSKSDILFEKLTKIALLLDPSLFYYTSWIFVIGALNLCFNNKNILILLMSLELMLLSATLNFIFFSLAYDNPQGQIYALFIITLAASETAVGMGLLISAFRLKKGVTFEDFNKLRG